MCVCACVCVCVHACVRVCDLHLKLVFLSFRVCVCVCVCVCVRARAACLFVICDVLNYPEYMGFSMFCCVILFRIELPHEDSKTTLCCDV